METVQLLPGDFFCSSLPGMFLSKAILGVERIMAKDNQAELSHSGIIIDKQGATFEALWRVTSKNVWESYGGEDSKLIIGRHLLMDKTRFDEGWMKIKKREGAIYPVFRLPMFLIPGLTKYLPFGVGVCSEVTRRFLCYAGLESVWSGWMPDDVADYIVRDRLVKIVYHKNITSYPKDYLDSGGETIHNYGRLGW